MAQDDSPARLRRRLQVRQQIIDRQARIIGSQYRRIQELERKLRSRGEFQDSRESDSGRKR